MYNSHGFSREEAFIEEITSRLDKFQPNPERSTYKWLDEIRLKDAVSNFKQLQDEIQKAERAQVQISTAQDKKAQSEFEENRRKLRATMRDILRLTDPICFSPEDMLIEELLHRQKLPKNEVAIEAFKARLDELNKHASAIQTKLPSLREKYLKGNLTEAEKIEFSSLEKIDHEIRSKKAAIALAKTLGELKASPRVDADTTKRRNDVLWQSLPDLGLNALCFSGGGIRSASFSLGVTQALSKCSYDPATGNVDGILTEIDYLSTVSGGGYTGSLLTRWSTRTEENPGASFEQTIRELAKSRPLPQYADPEPNTIRNLRSFSSYLSPKLGFFTGDSWTLVSTYLRNVTLNWIILVPAIALLMLLPEINRSFGTSWVRKGNSDLILFVASILIGMALLCIFLILPGTQLLKDVDRKFLRWCVPGHIGLIVFGSFFISAWVHNILEQDANHRFLSSTANHLRLLVAILILSFGWLRYTSTEQERWYGSSGTRDFLWHGLKYWTAYVIAGFAAAGVVWLMLSVVLRNLFQVSDGGRLFSALATPAVIAAFVLSAFLLNGFISLLESDDDREWWARSEAYLLIVATAWVLVHGMVLYSDRISQVLVAGLSAIAGPVLGAFGFSRFSPSGLNKSSAQLSGPVKQILARYALPISAFAVLISLMISVSLLNTAMINWISGFAGHSFSIYTLSCVVMIVLGNLFFNVNTFSMHGLYRNRLMRAFLGSANPRRNPDLFTRFDPDDNVHLCDAPVNPKAPLHILNATLNTVGGSNLAWQERKAESFTFSPLKSGNARLGYQRTVTYGGERGPTLATTMAISGAAASPNQGYNSSSLMTMLMTFFNVRLGWAAQSRP